MTTQLTPDTALAVALLRTANLLGYAEQAIQDRVRTPGHTIREEKPALDALWIHAPDVRTALRTLAMRLDRGALDLYCDTEAQDQKTASLFAETAIN